MSGRLRPSAVAYDVIEYVEASIKMGADFRRQGCCSRPKCIDLIVHCLALEDVDGATTTIKRELTDITGKRSGPVSLDQLQGVLVNLGVVLGHDEMRDLRAALLRPSSTSSTDVMPIAPSTDADADGGGE